jgi:hypothetical protein
MAGYDDDEQRAAYDRAIEFARDNATFADIIQHYDDTARPDHDDIDYDPAGLDDLDGAEYDNRGVAVILVDPDIISNISAFIIATYEHGSFDNIPDDYEFDTYASGGDNCGHFPKRERFYRCANDDDSDDDLPAD